MKTVYFAGVFIDNEGYGVIRKDLEQAYEAVVIGSAKEYFIIKFAGVGEEAYLQVMEEFAKRKWHVAEPLARELKDAVRVGLAM